MEQNLTKELLLQYANHSSEKVRHAALNRICDELLKENKGLLDLQDILSYHHENFPITSLFKHLPQRALLMAGEEDVWKSFFAVASFKNNFNTSAFMAVLALYRNEKTPAEIKERCWQWLKTDRPEIRLSSIFTSLLKEPYDEKLIDLAVEKCQKGIESDFPVAHFIALIPDEEICLKLRLVKAVICQKVYNANRYLAGALLNDLSRLSPEMSEKYTVPVIETVIAAFKDLPQKFEVEEKYIKIIAFLQNEALITSRQYCELLGVLAEGSDDITSFRLTELLAGLITCLKDDKKNFVLVNKTLQKVFALDDLTLRQEALYIHACIARFMKFDEDFKVNHFEAFKQDLYRYAGIFKEAGSSRFEGCYSIWFNLDDTCFLELAKNTPMFDSKIIIKLLNFAANKTPKGWKKVFDVMDWDNLTEPKSVLLAVLNFVVLPEYDAMRFDAIKAMQQLLLNKFSDEDADYISAKLKEYDLAGIFKVIRQEDPQEIEQILNLLKQ